MTSDVLVVYNEYYDNVPLGYYRYLFEALSKEYDYIKLKGFYDVGPFNHKVVLNLTPFANTVIQGYGKVIQCLDDMHSHNGDYSGFEKILDNSSFVFGTEVKSKSVLDNPFWQKHAGQLKWLPHFAYPYDINTDFSAKQGFFNSGHSTESVYPFRYAYTKIFNPIQGGHPGYDPKIVDPQKINQGFYEQISKYQFCSACGGNYGYVVSKYFEIPYCGSILIGEKNNGLDELGFVDGENCLLFTKEELINNSYERICGLTQKDLAEISEAGAKLIRDKHMLSNRLNYIQKIIKELLEVKEK
ncbi:MAG: glycosyltransferase [Candidatus Nanoarchaeia archaeon]